jgi:hypothetical protein
MRLFATLGIVVGSLAPLMPLTAGAQQPAPVTEAFRTYLHEMYPKLILAADAMPAAKYRFRATPTTQTFGEIVWVLGDYGRYICGRTADVRPPWPRRPELTRSSPKDSLVERLRDDARFCEAAFARPDEARLADTVDFDLRLDPVGGAPRVARGAAMIMATAYLSDMYTRLSEMLRLKGIVPPKPSGASVSDPNPGSGIMRCDNARGPREGERWAGPGFTFTLSDASPSVPYSVTSDGQGPYRFGTSNVLVVAAVRAGVMVLGGRPVDGTPRRAIRVDLTRPVPAGGGPPLGVITDSSHLEVAVQWRATPQGDRRRAQVLHDIPVGTTVTAAQLDVQFHINGVVHALQMGPQPIGHCFSDPPAVHGRGTSSGTIFRADSTTWIVDLPPGSIGRLYDVSLSYPHAVDKGLYYVSLHFILKY